MTYLLLALLVPLVCLAAGYALAALEPRPTEEAPPLLTDRCTRTPLRGVLHPPAGNQQRLEAAPHPEVLVNRLWASRSLWRSK